MKIIIFFTFLISMQFVFGQNLVVKYDYTLQSFKEDILKSKVQIVTIKSNDIVISKSYGKFFNDSIIYTVEHQDIPDMQEMAHYLANTFKANYIKREFIDIVKDDKLLILDELSAKDKFYWKEDKPKFDWKLINDTLTIHGFLCRAAQLRHAGRNYTAYYTQDIPIPVGPYKFNGLPGLIVKMVDDHDEHRFELISINIDDTEFINKYIPYILESKGVEIDDSDTFQKMKTNYKATIIERMEEMGIYLDDERKIKIRRGQNQKQSDNPIELLDN